MDKKTDEFVAKMSKEPKLYNNAQSSSKIKPLQQTPNAAQVQKAEPAKA